MWHLLKQTDIDQARQQLKLRLDATLRRHAEETQGLDADQAELETLNRLLDSFSRKFKTSPSAAPPPAEPYVTTKQTEPAPPQGNTVDRPPQKVRHLDHRDHARTNFDAFTRAVAKAERGW